MKDADYYDQQLYDYVREQKNHFDEKTIEILIKRYPNDKTTIYRGINFIDKDSYDKFINKFTKPLKINNISSWSEDLSTAKQFAITQPSYSLNPIIMQTYQKAQDEKEELTGYRGVIFKLELKPSTAIDATKSPYSIESEVILPPGEYEISIFKILKPFKEIISNQEIDINDQVQKITSEILNNDNSTKKLFDYILHHHINDLNDKSKNHLFKLYQPKIIDVIHKLDKNEYDKTFPNQLSLYMPYTYINMAYKGYFNKNNTEIAKKQIRQLLKNAILIIKKHWYEDVKLQKPQLLDLAKFVDMETEILNAYKDTFGQAYSNLSKNAVKNINNISDPKKRKEEIEKFSEKIKNILSQIN
jgi:hypothetical protein